MEHSVYWISLGAAGCFLFIALLRLFSSDWQGVVNAFIYLVQPWAVSAAMGERDEDNWSTMKVIVVLLITAYLVFYFHWKLGHWWMGVIQQIV